MAAASVTEDGDPVADRGGAVSELPLLPGEGHAVVGRSQLVELSGRMAAWFDRWL